MRNLFFCVSLIFSIFLNAQDADKDGILDVYEFESCGAIADPGFENPTAAPTAGYDNFQANFNGSSWGNSNNTAGYFISANFNPNNRIQNPLPPSGGNGYVGFHSPVNNLNGEVIRNNLVAPLVAGNAYIFVFDGYQINIDANLFFNPGQVKVFGIRTGANPVLNGTTQTNPTAIETIPNVDLLATSDLVNNTTQWRTFTIPFTANFEYDRILIAIEGNWAFLGLDNIDFLCAHDTDNDGTCLLYTSPSPRDKRQSRMPSSA